MKIENVLLDGIGYVDLLDSMGSDSEIVRRARICYQSQDKSTNDSDGRLLKKLIGSKPLHGTTLRGVIFTFDVVSPLFVQRQWTRHLAGHDNDGNDGWYTGTETMDIGGSFDERSFRYTEPDKFYNPFLVKSDDRLCELWDSYTEQCMSHYRSLRNKGVDKQLARCFIPDSVYTQMTWTVNGQAVLDWLGKRLPGGGAQPETSKYAEAVLELVTPIIPKTIAIWKEQR